MHGSRTDRWGCLPEIEFLQAPCMVAGMGDGLIGRSCRKGDAQSCKECTAEAVGLSASILGCGGIKCGLIQPILDIHSNKVIFFLIQLLVCEHC